MTPPLPAPDGLNPGKLDAPQSSSAQSPFPCSNRIKRRSGALWNPARRYLFWGSVCARIGTTLTIIFTLFIALAGLVSWLT